MENNKSIEEKLYEIVELYYRIRIVEQDLLSHSIQTIILQERLKELAHDNNCPEKTELKLSQIEYTDDNNKLNKVKLAIILTKETNKI